MELKKEQYDQISECFPKQRKPVKISNLEVLNAVLYVVENGRKWRRLPKEYGDWHAIYVRATGRKKGPVDHSVYLLMDRAYEGDETRTLAMNLDCIPVVPPKSDRKNPRDYDKQLYKQRNQVERFFRRLKRFRRMFTRDDKLKAGPLWSNPRSLVFSDDDGGPITQQVAEYEFSIARSAAGLVECRLHDLRHTYAANSIRAGDDIKTIQGNLGHATAAFTLDVYGHVTDAVKQDSAARMERFIRDVMKL